MAVPGVRPADEGGQDIFSVAGRRFLEAVPGLITWTVLLSPAWIPLLWAVQGAFAVALGVLVFDVYWFLRSFFVIFCIHHTYFHLRRDMGIDWLARCESALTSQAGRR